jgi:DNA invertase Pin-like site-specific DNA recombinase
LTGCGTSARFKSIQNHERGLVRIEEIDMADYSKQAVAYFRTSSETNADGDSRERQAAAVHEYARAQGIEIVGEYHDVVTGVMPTHERPEFVAMLARLLANGCRTILVETASRFARDQMVLETGYQMLKAQGIEVIATDSPGMFLDDGPTAKFVRTVLAAAAELEKALTVAKLKGARDRASAKLGRRVEGGKNFGHIPADHARRAVVLRATGRSLTETAQDMALEGLVSQAGTAYSKASVLKTLKRGAA